MVLLALAPGAIASAPAPNRCERVGDHQCRQPLRQAANDLHLGQIRSPAHTLGNGRPHIRHRLVLRSESRSVSGALSLTCIVSLRAHGLVFVDARHTCRVPRMILCAQGKTVPSFLRLLARRLNESRALPGQEFQRRPVVRVTSRDDGREHFAVWRNATPARYEAACREIQAVVV